MSTVRLLRERGDDVVHLRDEGLQRASDGEILQKALAEHRVVLTFDLDFGDLLAAVSASLPSVIVFRLRNQTPAYVAPRLLQVVAETESSLSTGAVIVVEDSRFRVRRLPIRPQ